MSDRERLLEKIRSRNKNISLAEVDGLLLDMGFQVRKTNHTYLYHKPGDRFSVNAHNKILHPEAIKDLRKLLTKLGIIE